MVNLLVDRQRAQEFTKAQRKEYDNVYGEQLEKSLNKPESDKSEKLNRNGDI